MNLLCGFVAPGCAKPYNLKPIRVTEPPFTSLNDLREVEKFRINQLCPLGKGANRGVYVQSFLKELIVLCELSVVVGGLLGIFTRGIIIRRPLAASSLLNLVCHPFPSRERWFCSHLEGGDARDPEISSDSLRGAQQELNCDLVFLTPCPVRMPLFFFMGCFRRVPTASDRTALPPSPPLSVFLKFMSK